MMVMKLMKKVILMYTKETAYRVDCPISNQPEDVYIRSTLWEGVFVASFNGCNGQWSSSAECESCRKAAQARFAAEHSESPSIHWNRP